MKQKFTAFKIFLAIAALPLVSLAGCSETQDAPQTSTYSGSSTNNPTSTGNSESDTEKLGNNFSDDSAPSIPKGEPTFLIGLDGKAILTSEITRLEDTDKTAETLTEDDLWAEVYCDGFAYYKEPCGVGYDSYNNPELFDGYDFLGEVPENKNEWKRVNVGDEICGMKVKAASVNFYVHDWEEYKFPERYLHANKNWIEFEGTIEAEGFLQVNNNSVQYPETNGLMWFYPTSINLPIVPTSFDLDDEKGFVRRAGVTGTYNHHSDFLTFGEFDEINLGNIKDIQCDMNGIGTGDIAYARVTLKDVAVGGAIGAKLENVELLSDILVHDEDDTEIHQPAPVL